VCGDSEAESLIRIILETAHTGKIGDGRILVSNIERLINIRTGAEGEGAL
jgi:nitrogen regulatory protein PII